LLENPGQFDERAHGFGIFSERKDALDKLAAKCLISGRIFGELLKREIMNSLMAKIGVLFIRNSLRRFKKHLDYSEYGGAPLLGINGVVMIGHGRSSAKAIKNAIKSAVKEVESNVKEEMIESIKSVTAKADHS